MTIDRRTVLGGALGGFFGLAMRNHCDTLLAALPGASPTAKAKRCIVLWMNGGPSQIETFDPKPGTATGGQFKSLATPVTGLRISETLPEISKRMDSLSVIRNLSSPEGEHQRGQYYLHSGFRFVPGFPRPSMGSVVSHEAPPAEFPQYVSIGSRGYGPAYMGPDHAPFSIENADEALELMRSIRQKKTRIGLLQELGADFDTGHGAEMLRRRRAMITRIKSLVTTPFVEALELDKEGADARKRYGDNEVARSFLLARRLLEVGVPFVELQVDGWDTHANNFPRVRQLCESIDTPWSALMDDLNSSGMLDETIVLWMGEFGRTPNINGQAGRDHFPQVTPVAIGGGGIPGGQIVGATNRTGTEIDGDAYGVPDLFATVFAALGIDPAAQFTTAFDSPTSATDDGKVIQELLRT